MNRNEWSVSILVAAAVVATWGGVWRMFRAGPADPAGPARRRPRLRERLFGPDHVGAAAPGRLGEVMPTTGTLVPQDDPMAAFEAAFEAACQPADVEPYLSGIRLAQGRLTSGLDEMVGRLAVRWPVLFELPDVELPPLPPTADDPGVIALAEQMIAEVEARLAEPETVAGSAVPSTGEGDGEGVVRESGYGPADGRVAGLLAALIGATGGWLIRHDVAP